jgi:hypothetical protein
VGKVRKWRYEDRWKPRPALFDIFGIIKIAKKHPKGYKIPSKKEYFISINTFDQFSREIPKWVSKDKCSGRKIIQHAMPQKDQRIISHHSE